MWCPDCQHYLPRLARLSPVVSVSRVLVPAAPPEKSTLLDLHCETRRVVRPKSGVIIDICENILQEYCKVFARRMVLASHCDHRKQ